MTPDDIVIVEYDPTWPQRYEEGRAQILAALGGLVVDIEHFGSTSVPGLSANPVVDIMAAVCDLPLTDAHLSALGELGYVFRRHNEP